ncbi:MAG: M15 family metallopeptidase [Brumimicrobium sp.]|nr:M15 family metallopeptidase [Brumimicrobium sp.]
MCYKIGCVYLILIALTFSCKEENNTGIKNSSDQYVSEEVLINAEDSSRSEASVAQKKEIDTLEMRLIIAGLVDIQSVDSSIRVDVKYSSSDNFMKKDLYGKLEKIYLQKEVAERLAKSQRKLKATNPDLTLLVYDGVRPLSVQQAMWDSLDSLSFSEKIKFVSNPKNGSLHNYGCAVDLTILNTQTGQVLDMGAGYDDLRKIAYPKFEQDFLASGELTKEQYNNRQLLRGVMRAGGFWGIQTEWWHFNAFSRPKAKELYDIVQ